METCSVSGYGIPTWGPSRKTKNLIATAFSGASSDQDSLLRISKYDVNSPTGLIVKGMTKSPAAFSSLDWIDHQSDTGIIAGGMADGAITLWDPTKILDGDIAPENLRAGKGCVSAT
jgi:protein transport protein SEC31